MEVKARIAIERQIVRRIATDAIAAGHLVAVHDGEDWAQRRTQDVGAIMAAVMFTDEERLYIYRNAAAERAMGQVFLVYGNDGWDVIADYSISLESLLAGANELAERLEGRAS